MPQWGFTPFFITSFVADIPERPDRVALPSASAKGKEDRMMVVPRSYLEQAVSLFHRRNDFKPTITGAKGPPCEGVLRGTAGKNGTQRLRGSRAAANAAVMLTTEPYDDVTDRFLPSLPCFAPRRHECRRIW